MNFFKVILGLIVFGLLEVSSIGQVPTKLANIPSPNAFTFQQYGSTPVTFFNGKPQIGVPLFSVQTPNLEVPVTMDYNASGVRLDNHPSWTGLNWNLISGGAVTRQVKGLPDEFYFKIQTSNNSIYQYANGYLRRKSNNDFTIQNILKTTGVYYNGSCGGAMYNSGHTLPFLADQTSYLSPNFTGYFGTAGERWLGQDGTYGALWNSTGDEGGNTDGGGIQDLTPDEFSFNFLGYSGKFYFKKQASLTGDDIFVQCNKKVKVDVMRDVSQNFLLNYTTLPFSPLSCGDHATSTAAYFNYSPWNRMQQYPKVLSGFTITGEDGIIFTFGKKYYSGVNEPDFGIVPIEVSTNLYKCNDFFTADTWYLSKITLPNNDEINFEYQRGGLIANKSISQTSTSLNGTELTCPNPNYGFNSGRVISPVYLSSIIYKNFLCYFDRSTSNELPLLIDQPLGFTSPVYGTDSWQKLDKIRIIQPGTNTQEINFNYNNNSAQRLMLNTIAKPHGPRSETYQFEYNTDKVLPGYLSNQTDHWGFWNGKTYTYNENNCFALKEPDADFLQAGTLKKIIYPTGGSTEFVFEANSYGAQTSFDHTSALSLTSSMVAGGLRIKEIKDFDNVTSTVKTKKYYYTKNFSNLLTENQVNAQLSSGILNKQVKYLWSDPNVNSSMYTIGFGADACMVVDNTVTTASVKVFSNQSLYPLFDDYHVNYSEIAEVNADNSYTIYKYTNYDNGYVDDPPVAVLNSTFSSPYYHVSSRNFERGQLLDKADFNNSNQIVSQESYTYQRVGNLLSPELCSMPLWEANLFLDNRSCDATIPQLNGFRYLALGGSYKFYNYWFYPKDIVKKTYNPTSGQYITEQQTFYYENLLHNQPTRITRLDSKNDLWTTKLKYPLDYTSTGGFLINRFLSSNSITPVLEKIQLKRNPANSLDYVINGEINEYGITQNGIKGFIPLISSQYKFESINSLEESQYQPVSTTTFGIGDATVWPKDSRYRKLVTIKKYDNDRNPVFMDYADGLKNLDIYGYNSSKIIARQTLGAYNSGNYSYTSFEQIPTYKNGYLEYVNDNTDWVLSGTFSTNSFSGSKAFNGLVTPLTTGFNVYSMQLLAKTNGAAPALHALNSDNSDAGVISTGTAMMTIGDWTVYNFTYAGNGRVQVNSNGNFIDELRLWPLGLKSKIVSYVYNDRGLMACMTDHNFKRTFYEYDEFNRLVLMRDDKQNIIRKICYNYAGQPENCFNGDANWQPTSVTRCQTGTGGYLTGHQERQEKDMNTYSATYNTIRYIDTGVNATACPIVADWQNFGSPSCVQSGGQNTGVQQQQQKDMNPYSSTYNQLRYVSLGTNTTACPTCTGNDKMIIGGVCVTGTKIYTASVYNNTMQKWSCKYHYEWAPNCVKSIDYFEYQNFSCGTTNGCIPD